VVSEQAAGLDAIGQARRVLRRGASVVLTGATEAPIGPYAIACQLASGLVSPAADPARCYLPFDAAASGYVPGEGGAILVLESEASVRARAPARSYGEVAGYAATFAPGGDTRRSLRRAIRRALADASAAASQVGAVFADAMAVPRYDAAEAAALVDVFGPYGVPVTAPKSMVGRLYAGGSALDAATALLAIRDGVIPPTAGSRPSPRYRLDVVTRARPARLRTALVLARGYRGFTSALVLRAPAIDQIGGEGT
jgi:act minimal PKS chain-length factor (CLF/KS beta)